MSLSISNQRSYSSIITPIYLLSTSQDEAPLGYFLQGLLAAESLGNGKFIPIGNIATSLSNSFLVAIRAFCHNFPRYSYQLKSIDFYFDCDLPQFRVGEDRSSSLSFIIGLLNILRSLNGLPQYTSYAATGILSLDGTISNVTYLKEKEKAAFSKIFISHFISPKQYSHIIEMIDTDLNLKINI